MRAVAGGRSTRWCRQAPSAVALLVDNPAALDRMDGIGTVRPSLARDFGLVGPPGRACGLAYDVRAAMREAPYGGLRVACGKAGDVLARVDIRARELLESLRLLDEWLVEGGEGPHRVAVPDALPADALAVGLVEAWRGELVHLVFTDGLGRISRYAIKDPSFDNWTGLAIAARGELVSDFPLCNKSFGLSYSGNDL